MRSSPGNRCCVTCSWQSPRSVFSLVKEPAWSPNWFASWRASDDRQRCFCRHRAGILCCCCGRQEPRVRPAPGWLQRDRTSPGDRQSRHSKGPAAKLQRQYPHHSALLAFSCPVIAVSLTATFPGFWRHLPSHRSICRSCWSLQGRARQRRLLSSALQSDSQSMWR